MSTFLQSADVPLQVSANNGSTWLDVVCPENYTVDVSPQTTPTNTLSCGKAIGVGPIDFSANGSAVVDSSALSTQATFKHFLNWANTKQLIAFRSQSPGSGGSIGNDFFIAGNARVTKLTLKLQAADVIKWDFELTGDGLVDINSPFP